MPLNPKAGVSDNIRELHTGKTYAHTAEKFGAERANRQAVAIALETQRRARRADGGPALQPLYDAFYNTPKGRFFTQGMEGIGRSLSNAANAIPHTPEMSDEEYFGPTLNRLMNEDQALSIKQDQGRAEGGVAPKSSDPYWLDSWLRNQYATHGVPYPHPAPPASTLRQLPAPEPEESDDPRKPDRRDVYPTQFPGPLASGGVVPDDGPADVTPDPDWQTATEGLGQTLGRDLHDVWLGLKTAAQIGRERLKRDYQPSWYNPQPERATGGVVPHYDAGGTVNPVQAVITALNAGANTSGLGSASMGSANPAAPSAPAAGATTAAPATATSNPAVPASTMQANPATATTAPQTAPAMATTATPVPTAQQPAAPMQTKLMATGGVAERAMGGGFGLIKPPSMDPMYRERQETRNMMHTGPIMSATPGRADKHLMKVPSGSYILPSTTIASMGQGNSLAGMRLANHMFGAPKISAGPGAPRAPHGLLASGGIALHSEGGARGEDDEDNIPVDVWLSGGEFSVHPRKVREIGGGNLKHGHKIFDAFVMRNRAKEIKTLKNLPEPAKR